MEHAFSAKALIKWPLASAIYWPWRSRRITIALTINSVEVDLESTDLFKVIYLKPLTYTPMWQVIKVKGMKGLDGIGMN